MHCACELKDDELSPVMVAVPLLRGCMIFVIFRSVINATGVERPVEWLRVKLACQLV